MFRLFRPKAEPRPVDPRQWAEAFKQTRGDDVAPAAALVQPEPRKRDTSSFTVGS